MILTEQDYQVIKRNISIVESAIKNSSASSIPAELRDAVVRILKLNGFKGCSVCNSQMYVSLCRVYDYYLKDTMEQKAAESAAAALSASETVNNTTKKKNAKNKAK